MNSEIKDNLNPTVEQELKKLRQENLILIIQLKNLVVSIDRWNEAMQTIIGRVPESGMFTKSAHELLERLGK